MAEVSKGEALLSEYFKLQDIVEDFDSRALTIKTWSVTLSAAGIVTAYAKSAPTILLVAAESSAVFWVVEGLWKVNQQCFYPRIAEIEEALRNNEQITPLQIKRSWSEAYSSRKSMRYLYGLLRWPHVCLPHVVVTDLALALYFFCPRPPAFKNSENSSRPPNHSAFCNSEQIERWAVSATRFTHFF